MDLNMNWYERQVEHFQKIRPSYEEFARVLQTVLEKARKELGSYAIVQSRAKEVPSFAEKVIRKREKYIDPVHQLTDLCGARVIAETKDEVTRFCAFVEENFEIHEEEDASERLGTGEFGYGSVHYIVSLKRNVFEDIDIPKRLFARYKELKGKKKNRSEEHSVVHLGPKFKAEIQVRTLLQHAWAQLAHDNLYKNELKSPRHLERDAGRIAALLEDADDSFVRILDGLELYQTYHGAYKDRKEMSNELQILEAVQRHDPENPNLARQIARLAIGLQDWKKAERVLRPFQNLGYPDLLRDLGRAKLRLGKTVQGTRFLEKAAYLNPSDPATYRFLAEGSDNEENRLDLYGKAYEARPSDPEALAGFLIAKIRKDRSTDFVPLTRPALHAAIETCKKRAGAGVYLPHAFLNIGMFSVLLGQCANGLSAYTKAIQLSPTEDPIDVELVAVKSLQKAMGARLPALDQVRRLLQIGNVGKLYSLEKNATETARLKEQTVVELKDRISELKGKDLKELRGNLARAEKEAAEAGDEESRAVEKVKHGVKALRREATKEIGKILKPVVIVAGGCDQDVLERIGEYRSLIYKAFEGFEGTVFSGGTEEGIPGIVGDLAEDKGSGVRKMRKIGYLPRGKVLPADATEHRGYENFETKDHEFGAAQPLQCWLDILAAGVRPEEVKLLGVNGGDIAAIEFRLALALGAQVGILRDSGRAASELSQDGEWSHSPGLAMLPADEQTLRAFIRLDTGPVFENDPEATERMARNAHRAYQENQRGRFANIDPAFADWDKLSPDLKQANYAQVAHIREKLRAVGMDISKVEGREPFLKEFDKDQIQTMAEMEHGRWNVERLLSGWKLSEERNHEKKLSPYLVEWGKLLDDVKKWDRQAVEQIPSILAEIGYEIVPSE